MASDSGTHIPLGTWAGGDFTTTVSQHRGVGVDADVPSHARFIAGVARLVLQRMAETERRGEPDEPGIAIFVLNPNSSDSVPTAKRVPMLDNGLTVVVGRLWVTGPPVVSARYVELPQDDDDDKRFSYVEDELGFGAQPTLVFDSRPALAQLRWYPRGLERPDAVEIKPLGGEVNARDVFDVIDHVHRECLITPNALSQTGSPWFAANRYLPSQSAEAIVQWNLKVGLVAAFPSCTIRHEQTQQTGRTDLEIEQCEPLDHSVVTRHAVLELKVLRSFRETGAKISGGQTDKWIADGVTQAAAYRDNREARWSALCCFDMRQADTGDESCFESVRVRATGMGVLLWRWFLYASSKAYRQAATD